MNRLQVFYEPNKYIKAGFFSLWRQMFLDLRKSLELGFRLFLRDFSAKYKQSLLGVLWVVLLPLFAVAVFVIMNRSGILNIRATGIPYPIFALFGMTVWSLFTGLTSSISGVVGQTGGLVTKINFPRIALVQSPILTSIVDFLIRLVLLLVVMIIYRTTPDTWSFLLPLTLLPIFIISIGIGMVLSIIGAVFKDIANFVNMFLSIAMFLTPVMYPLPNSGILRKVNAFNPLYYFVEIPRNIFFHGRINHGTEFMIFALISLLVFFLGWRFYHVAMARIVEKI